MNRATLVGLVCYRRSCIHDSCPFYVGYCKCTIGPEDIEIIKTTIREWVISLNYQLDGKLVEGLSIDGYTVDDFLNAIGLESVSFV